MRIVILQEDVYQCVIYHGNNLEAIHLNNENIGQYNWEAYSHKKEVHKVFLQTWSFVIMLIQRAMLLPHQNVASKKL